MGALLRHAVKLEITTPSNADLGVSDDPLLSAIGVNLHKVGRITADINLVLFSADTPRRSRSPLDKPAETQNKRLRHRYPYRLTSTG